MKIRMAHVATAATTVFLLLLALLHILKPEINPSWRMISEYEIGRFGWLMQIAFFTWAAGSISLFFLLWPLIKTFGGKVGIFLLLVASLGMIIGGIFVSDPITTARDAFSTTGMLHNIGGALMMLSTPFVVTLISWSLLHQSRSKGFLYHCLLLLIVIIWLSLIAYFSIYAFAGHVGPDVPIGWPNRVFVLSYSIWVIAAAQYCTSIKRK